MLSKVVDEATGAQNVHRRQVVGPGGVVMIPMDGEDGEPNVQIGVQEVGLPV
jgi:hypothetical protein